MQSWMVTALIGTVALVGETARGVWDAKHPEIRRLLPSESFASSADGAGRLECRDFQSASRGSTCGATAAAEQFVVEIGGAEVCLDRVLGPAAGGYLAFGASASKTLRAWFHSADNHWVIVGHSGLRSTFGGSAGSRLGSDVAVAAGTLAWALSRVEDANGNSVEPHSSLYRILMRFEMSTKHVQEAGASSAPSLRRQMRPG